MPETTKIRVAVNGYGVIGKRVADAVVRQEDMVLAGVSDVVADWRVRTVTTHGFRLFGATGDHADRMRAVGLDVAGTSDELLNQADVVVDCTPKHVAAKNIDGYRRRGVKFIVQGGEKHETTGHSFVAESNYVSALDRESTRVVSCNTTSIVRTLSALKRVGLLQRARGTLLPPRDRSLGKPRRRNHEHAGAGARDSEPPRSRRPERRSGTRRDHDGGQGA